MNRWAKAMAELGYAQDEQGDFIDAFDTADADYNLICRPWSVESNGNFRHESKWTAVGHGRTVNTAFNPTFADPVAAAVYLALEHTNN